MILGNGNVVCNRIYLTLYEGISDFEALDI